MASLSKVNKAKVKCIVKTLLLLEYPDGLTSREISEFIMLGGFGLNQRITPSVISGLLQGCRDNRVNNYMNGLITKHEYSKTTQQSQLVYYWSD